LIKRKLIRRISSYLSAYDDKNGYKNIKGVPVKVVFQKRVKKSYKSPKASRVYADSYSRH
jgi:hypothetical protein